MYEAGFQNILDDRFQVVAVGPVQPVFCSIPCCKQCRGFSEDAAVAGVILKGGLQLNAEERYLRVKAFHIGDVPEPACFGGAEGSGIEAVFTGILIAFLTPALALVLCHVSSQPPGNLTREVSICLSGSRSCGGVQ